MSQFSTVRSIEQLERTRDAVAEVTSTQSRIGPHEYQGDVQLDGLTWPKPPLACVIHDTVATA